ncbi:MAG: SH3 domain-containing protein [Anaerolinea sp.]|nr:SH3 domain-containing protein [Anaerolinea sp.]
MIRLLFLVSLLVFAGIDHAAAQESTPTPAVINLSAVAPAPPAVEAAIPTPTRTPEPPTLALLEAKELANVRAEPSTESAQLGTIRTGEFYTVIGRYVRWLQFEFPSSPTGRGWVYDELVNITGDASTIPELDLAAQATDDPILAGLTQTQSVVTLTPGGALTATQIVRSGIISTAVNETATRQVMPTFTYPPELVAIAPTVGSIATIEPAGGVSGLSDNTQVPPLVPILAIGGVGLLGLAISSLRRG